MLSRALLPLSHLLTTALNLTVSLFFFTLTWWKKLKQTNRYAASRISFLRRHNKLKRNSLWNKWKTVTLNEIYKFFSITLHMSVLKLPHINDYWTRDVFLSTRFSNRLLSRDRFKAILYMLHLNNNEQYINRGKDGYDPIYKIRPLFDFFSQKMLWKFPPLCKPYCWWMYMPFHRSCKFSYLHENKPNRYGIKLFTLCCLLYTSRCV